MQPTLKRLVSCVLLMLLPRPRTDTTSPQNTRFQTHMCGEGGEYETFTLDCPIFKQRVVLCVVPALLSLYVTD